VTTVEPLIIFVSKHLSVMRPSARFRIVGLAGRSSIDPSTYGRYAAIADAVESIDPTGAASVHATLKPRIEEAHRDLGSASVSFDSTLERALVVLLKTPIGEDSNAPEAEGDRLRLRRRATRVLMAAQKHLLRRGPRNVGIVRRGLRSIALTPGIPASHLPAD
jgi:Protein of unknown function (DUF3014)